MTAADPIFDQLAQAALDRGFAPDDIALGKLESEPTYRVWLFDAGRLYIEYAVDPLFLEEAAGDPAGMVIDRGADYLQCANDG